MVSFDEYQELSVNSRGPICHEEVLVADAFLSLYAFRGVCIGEQHVGGVRRSVTLKKERKKEEKLHSSINEVGFQESDPLGTNVAAKVTSPRIEKCTPLRKHVSI